MVRYNKSMKKLFGLVFGILMLVGLCAPAMAAGITCPDGTIRKGKTVDTLAECNIEDTGTGSAEDFTAKYGGKAVNILLMIVGIASVIVIIIAGVIMMTSQGDAAKVKMAKSAIVYAIIGLLIALAAFMIVNFVLGHIFK